MWWKILLLTLYLSVLFILSRILEAVAYYEGGYLSSRLLDPVSLSVRKLKAILDQRGVGYTGVVEQKELTELVTTSGGVSDGELEVAVMALADESTEVVSTNFTCGTHFYEEVEDTKDSVWVVQVVCDHHSLFMQHNNWKMFVKKVSRFGVRTGIFDCTLDKYLCERKKWYRSQLVLALPQGYRAKDEVALKSYVQSSQHQAVFDWVNRNLASRISQAHSLTELSEQWFRFKKKSGSEKIRVLLFSRMTIPPMFYSVLSVKFTGRVKFGIVDVNTRKGKLISSHLNLTDEVPAYMVLTPETNKTFGKGDGEYLNYQSMGLFLRTLHPEVNDIFLLSLIVINMACWLEFFIARGNLFKRLGRVLWDIVKWNFLLILLWLPVLGLFQLPYMDTLFDHLLTALRVVGMTNFAGYVRSDWLWYSSVGWAFFVVTFLLFSCSMALVHYLYQGPEQLPSSETTSGFWNLQWESYFSNLFQPMASLARPTNPHAYSMELGMELLIERLAVPNLWLRPIISNQYIHELPIWKHQGPCMDSDIGSDSECLSLRTESDCEESAASGSEVPAGGGANGQREFGPKPLMFICEKCRVLQNNNAGAAKSAQELEEEQAESESACAKYLMDGDYKCMCGHQDTGHRSPHRDQSRASSRTKAPAAGSGHDPDVAAAAAQGSDPHHQMPPGIIATVDCSICLESYKHEAVLCGLPCGHAFHQHCIMGWLNRDNHHCPICRWPAYKAKPCNAHLHSE